MSAINYICEAQECFTTVGVRTYERTDEDLQSDEDGNPLTTEQREAMRKLPVALCEEHKGQRNLI